MKGGALGLAVGLGGGLAGVALAQRRYHAFRSLTLPLKAFLVTSSATFGGIIAADHGSRKFEMSRNVQDQYFAERQKAEETRAKEGMTLSERAFDWGRRERYKIVGASWVASMIGAFALVGRNPYLTGQQKLVQARVYAQGLTLAVLIAVASFEVSERRREEKAEREGHPIHHDDEDSHDQSDLWKDMVKAEEQRLAERDKAIKAQEEKERKNHKHRKAPKPQEPKKFADEDGPEPVPGKKGEGKSMKKTTDQPDKSAVP